jgi:hypothetical protein
MNAATIDLTTYRYGVNVYSNLTAHIIKSWKNVSDRKYTTLCGRAGGGNSSLFVELPSCFDLCPKCAERSNA